MEFARKYDKCQRFAPVSKAHLEKLTTMTSPWPFVVWGIDLIGQLPKGRGEVQYVVVAVDYFSKWVKAEALASITSMKIKQFVYRTSFVDMEHHTQSYQTMTSNLIAKSLKNSVLSYKLRSLSPQLRNLKLMVKWRL